MRVPFVDLCRQHQDLREELVPALERVLASAAFALGPEVEAFEEAFSRFVGTRHCVGVASGTAALHLALVGAGVGPGDEVVTVPNSFVATSWAISYVGARPVFVDVVPGSWTMDVERLEAAITERTRAVLPVHLYGHPCDLPRIAAICRARGVALIEDAAQAHGAAWEGIGVGAAGLASCFSFYPSKNLGACGEAGAVCTDDDALARRLRRLRNNAQGERNQHEELGFNYRMDGLQAAILGVKLKHLRAWNERRTERARLYARGLQGMPNLELPRLPASARSAWHLFVVHHPRREALRQALAEAGVETGLHYPRPIHLQEAYRCLGHGAGAFPVAEYNASRCLSLPLHAELAEAQLEHVCGAVRACCERLDRMD